MQIPDFTTKQEQQAWLRALEGADKINAFCSIIAEV